MFPFFEPFSGFIIYSFGIAIMICFFCFLWMLKKLSVRFSYDYSIFPKNILWYVLITAIVSRLFFIILEGQNISYIKQISHFFIMSDYNFSLIGAIVGFLGVLYVNLRLKKDKFINYIDGIVLSLLFILPIGYIGSLLGGQVYGRETTLGIELLYTHPYTPVPFQVPIFPLPIVYSISFFLTFCCAYILSMFVHIKGFIGYVFSIVIACLFLILEFFSGKYDILRNASFPINCVQIFSILIIIICGIQLYKILKTPINNEA